MLNPRVGGDYWTPDFHCLETQAMFLYLMGQWPGRIKLLGFGTKGFF